MNKVILIGRLARDVELRATQSNISVAKFTIAVSRPYNSKDLEQPETDFINCVVWRKLADNLAKYCHKGSQIAVEGKLQNRDYTTNDGQKKYITEVICEKIVFLSQPKNDNQSNANVNNVEVEQTVNNMINQEDPFRAFAEENEISDDDLPFN